MQAVRSGNPVQLQQAQLNIAQRRAGIKTPVGATPAAFGTPGATLLRTPGVATTPAFGTPAMTPGLHVTAGKQPVHAIIFAKLLSSCTSRICCSRPHQRESCVWKCIHQASSCFGNAAFSSLGMVHKRAIDHAISVMIAQCVNFSPSSTPPFKLTQNICNLHKCQTHGCT